VAGLTHPHILPLYAAAVGGSDSGCP
jgi:hypothetical protein